jgi:uncharacterized protein YbcI
MTRVERESELRHGLIRLEKELRGRGPSVTRVDILEGAVVVRLTGALTAAELGLAEDGSREVLKRYRLGLIERARPRLEEVVRRALDAELASLHADVSTRTGEMVLVLTLADRADSGTEKSRMAH